MNEAGSSLSVVALFEHADIVVKLVLSLLLAGSVWGIMRSFNAIAAANNTSLAVVAPGIADALFATAMGLAAAIPAVVAYNKFTVEIGRFSGVMQGLIGRSSGLLSRAAAEGD